MSTSTETLAVSKRDRVFAAIDKLEHCRKQWQNSSDPAPSDIFWIAFDDLIVALADGHAEEELRGVYLAALGLVEEKQASETAYDPLPRHSVVGVPFWRFFDRLVDARRGISKPLQPPKQVESVATLVAQSVSHVGIARAYGWRNEAGVWSGPFFNEFGNATIALIDQEAKSPGSVLGDNWVHPESAKRLEDQERQRTEFIDVRPLVAEARVIEHQRDIQSQPIQAAAGLQTQF